MSCSEDPDEIKCKESVFIELECHHSKEIFCYENQAYQLLQEKNIKIKDFFLFDNDLNDLLEENFLCKEIIEKSFKKCDHKINIECCDKDLINCEVIVSKELKCGHNILTECFRNSETIRCSELVKIQLKCGHFKDEACHSVRKYNEEIDSIRKNSIVYQKLSDKGYLCEELAEKKYFKCDNIVENFFEDCGHTIKLKCSEKDLFKRCNEIVPKELKCGHIKNLKCHEDSIDSYCTELVDFELNCGHIKKIKCNELKETKSFKDICDKLIRKRIQGCGHFVNIPCYRAHSDVLCNHPSHTERQQYYDTDEEARNDYKRLYRSNKYYNNYDSSTSESLKNYKNSKNPNKHENYKWNHNGERNKYKQDPTSDSRYEFKRGLGRGKLTKY
jgi:hypothetical protein